MSTGCLGLTTRISELELNRHGRRTWVRRTEQRMLATDRTAMLISDMWDRHWSEGASVRISGLATKINSVAEVLRGAGVMIVHAPSETMEYYAAAPARLRLQNTQQLEPAVRKRVLVKQLPIDDGDGGSETLDADPVDTRVWSRQHDGIRIDDRLDLIAGDEGELIYSALRERGIDTVLYSGVHANRCLLDRTFGIRQMLRWGVGCVLFEDLTDVIYNPARAPYVNHRAAHQLVIRYIEKFYCPTIVSRELEL